MVGVNTPALRAWTSAVAPGSHRPQRADHYLRRESLTGITLAESQDWLPLRFAVKLARIQGRPPVSTGVSPVC
jgi:hypothetical protein